MTITLDLLSLLRGRFTIRVELDERPPSSNPAPPPSPLDAMSDYFTERFAYRKLVRGRR